MIYLDYAATTPVDTRVADKMYECLTTTGTYGNPASLHDYGRSARDAVETARAHVADLINADAHEIIWTSGATEAINLALKGAASLQQRKGKHLITMKTEHKAVLDSCQHLEKEGFTVTYLSPQSNGMLDLDILKGAIRDDTIIVSIMHANNETGVVQDIDGIAKLTAERNILLHVDAAQSIGKVVLDMQKTPIDLLSTCAHKLYGPKGIGALYLRRKPRVRVSPLIHGGGHEQGMRSGTLPTHQIVGIGEAFRIAKNEMHDDYQKIEILRDQLLAGISTVPKINCNSDITKSVPHILNVRFEGMLAEAVLAQMPEVAVSTGSACLGKGTDGSYVLRAMGMSEEQAKSAVRISFGRFTTADEVQYLINKLITLFNKTAEEI